MEPEEEIMKFWQMAFCAAFAKEDAASAADRADAAVLEFEKRFIDEDEGDDVDENSE